ncbi:hypothetical protein P7C70_g1091, partial [Phenoliferia sp. Uapishka_3]
MESESIGSESPLTELEDERDEMGSGGSGTADFEPAAGLLDERDPSSDNASDSGPSGKRARSERSYSPEENHRAAKKKKTAAKPRKGRKAKLESFAQLPLDLIQDVWAKLSLKAGRSDLEKIQQICLHLNLQTILNLSRVNKQLHIFLVNSRSKPLWSGARQTTGLPVLQDRSFTELTLARLLYGSGCDLCGAQKHRSHRVDWELRVRYCSGCQVKLIFTDDPDEEAIVSWLSLEADREKAAREVMREERQDECDAFIRCSDECALESFHSHRIERRFADKGWSVSHFATEAWNAHRLFKVNTALTDRSWKHAEPILEELLRSQTAAIDLRDQATARLERLSLIEAIYRVLQVDEDDDVRVAGLHPLPSKAFFIELPCIKRLWDPVDAPEHYEVPYREIADALDEARDKLRTAIFFLLIERLGTSPSTPPEKIPTPTPEGVYLPREMDPVFDYISSLVKCTNCGNVDYFPEVLDHTCTGGRRPSFNKRSFTLASDSYFWNGSSKLLEAAGLEEWTTTRHDLAALGNCFTCETCPPSLGNTCRTFSQMVSAFSIRFCVLTVVLIFTTS